MKKPSSEKDSSKPRRTNLDCPSCRRVVPCWSLPKGKKGTHGRVAWPDAKDIIWYRRRRQCSNCGHIFVTAEMEAKHLDELRLLRKEAGELRAKIDQLRKVWKDSLSAVNNMSKVFMAKAGSPVPKSGAEK